MTPWMLAARPANRYTTTPADSSLWLRILLPAPPLAGDAARESTGYFFLAAAAALLLLLLLLLLPPPPSCQTPTCLFTAASAVFLVWEKHRGFVRGAHK